MSPVSSFLWTYAVGVKVLLSQLLSRSFSLPAGNHENQGELSVSRIVKETGNEKAAVMLVPQRNTADGFEEHFGVNYLGHFMLTHLLLDTLKQSGSHDLNSRIVTVSSATHYIGELNLNDLQSRHNYSPHGAYAQSKLALVLFSYQLQQRLAAEGSHVTSNVVDPGVVNTDLYKHTSWLFKLCKWLTSWLLFKTSTQGASTVIYAAVSPDLEGAGGSYYVNGQKVKSADISYDEDLQRKLWAQSCNLVGNPERHQCAS
ncbi:dehydrogenase/reductase SDR family member on chromosome X isoform X7 [Carcharodon carcharias]|uniref:dehydrogenase/reductase SDR family member on chromosome X isoform X7 n=1 Tax=Carcharodon carcharias TaxID=13397 RepID=UPI001B7F42DB|nr:dehydrogenase/reductase SDR family member on chromosome X isoform X7 [Carcharodon carcharias]